MKSASRSAAAFKTSTGFPTPSGTANTPSYSGISRIFARAFCFQGLLSFLLLGFVGSAGLHAAALSIVPVAMHVESGNREATLNVPAGCTSVKIERLLKGTWVSFQTLGVKSAPVSLRVPLPTGTPAAGWRATGTISAAPVVSLRKYPASFYSGALSFAPSMAPDDAAAGIPFPICAMGQAVGTAAEISDSASPVAIEESDIWKADGTTLYFFNRLRGLQILDLSDPSDPALLASLRLPASGQDLYIVPGAGGARMAVLLTNEYDSATWRSKTGIKVVNVAQGTAAIASETTLDGWLVDSRVVGDRLYVVTQDWSLPGGSSVTLYETQAGTGTVLSKHVVAGSSPVISAGAGWLAIAVQPDNDWMSSRVNLFALGNNGPRRLTGKPIPITGRVYDKYKINYSSGTLSVISQRWISSAQTWTSATSLENFTAAGKRLARLEIIRGEQLHATRFEGNKAYAVTFEQVDPLWVIDLSNPKNPTIAGHVEVPGWSTYIEPIGNLLFSVGFDGGKVTASLFDVSDPSRPTLLDREFMPGVWGHSEATYDEKALKVLAADGLVLIPFTSANADGGTDHFVQLLDLDVKNRALRQRGRIAHDFQPRRAAMIGGSLASISQRQLVTADISDRDVPKILAERLLAWPVDHLLAAGDFLIGIGAGNSWAGEKPMAVVTSNTDPDLALSELELGEGLVKGALVGENRFYLLRQTPADNWFYPMPVLFGAADRASHSTPNNTRQLHLDIYDISALPSITHLSTADVSIPAMLTSFETGELLQASPTRLVVCVQPQRWPFFTWPLLSGTIGQPTTQTEKSALAFVFDVATDVPKSFAPVELAAPSSSAVRAVTANDGLLVFGYGACGAPVKVLPEGTFSTRRHYLRILDVRNKPALRPAIDLPGQLVAVSDLSADGFLAWTESRTSANGKAASSRQIQVSACEGKDAFLVASLNLPTQGTLLADGRRLFSVQGNSVIGYRLSDLRLLNPDGSIALGWTPANLRAIPGGLLGSNWDRLFRAQWSDDSQGEVLDWPTDRAVNLARAIPLPDGSVLSPAGDYGVDVLEAD